MTQEEIDRLKLLLDEIAVLKRQRDSINRATHPHDFEEVLYRLNDLKAERDRFDKWWLQKDRNPRWTAKQPTAPLPERAPTRPLVATVPPEEAQARRHRQRIEDAIHALGLRIEPFGTKGAVRVRGGDIDLVTNDLANLTRGELKLPPLRDQNPTYRKIS